VAKSRRSHTQGANLEAGDGALKNAASSLDDFRGVLEKLPAEEREKASRILLSVTQTESFHGPLPSPARMAEYEAIYPGAFDRLLTLHEENEAHQRDLITHHQNETFRDRSQGMTYALIGFSLLVIGATISAIFTQDAKIVGAFMAAAAAGGITGFIQGRKGAAENPSPVDNIQDQSPKRSRS
jgi:uncharacterized membrane protein